MFKPVALITVFGLFSNIDTTFGSNVTSATFNVPNTQLAPVYFSAENNTEIISQIGFTVVLHCPVENIGENTASWIRKRDYHLLTIGHSLYSSDHRYQVRYAEENKDWQLHIRYVQKHDEGEFECQVSTYPPISLMSRLVVLEPVSEILGSPEKFLIVGSSLRLVCILRKTIQQPNYVFWYFNQKMVNHDSHIKIENSENISVLFLENLRPESSGNYSCHPSNAKSSHIRIHVLKGGEYPAAIHSGADQRNRGVVYLLTLSFTFLHLSVFGNAFGRFVARGIILLRHFVNQWIGRLANKSYHLAERPFSIMNY